METRTLKTRANELLDRIQTFDSVQWGVNLESSYDTTIFDTALVASLYCVQEIKTQETEKTYINKHVALFPDALRYLITQQQATGGWDTGMPDFKIGVILTTSAGLLAFLRKLKWLDDSIQGENSISRSSLALRARKAEEYLRRILSTQDLSSEPSCEHVMAWLLHELHIEGVSIHVPSLEGENGAGANGAPVAQKVIDQICSGWPSRDGHMEVQSDSFPEVYMSKSKYLKSTFGINRSPAATAFHLLQVVGRDLDYEAYLGMSIKASGGCGGVPAVFPEGQQERDMITELLDEGGLINSDYRLTAGIKTEKKIPMPATTGSLDESCRALKDLLQRPSLSDNMMEVKVLIESISEIWWNGTWGTTVCFSPFYAFMLFAQSFRIIYQSKEICSRLSADFIDNRGPIMILQMASQILAGQNSDGSWGKGTFVCLETAALALLALCSMNQFPFLGIISMDIRHAVEYGRQSLMMLTLSKNGAPRGKSFLWKGCTAHACQNIKEAYILSASAQCLSFHISEDLPSILKQEASKKALSLASFFHSLPALKKAGFFKLKAGAMESAYYVAKLKTMRNDIFPVTNAKEMDKYFDYIPIMWAISSIVRDAFVPPVLIWDISVLSMYIFLVDEYMEGFVAQFTAMELWELRLNIESIFASNEGYAAPSMKEGTQSVRVREASDVFYKWATYHMTYSGLISASTTDRLSLRIESKNYLLHHLTQLADNQRLGTQIRFSSTKRFESPSMGFAPWLHLVGSGHIGAPIGLVWFAACVGHRIRGPGKDCFSTVKQKLMVWNANSHAGKQLRMFNDYGSVARDAAESNLNSINFPEFFSMEAAGDEVGDDWFRVSQRKNILLDAALYERSCTDREMNELYAELKKDGKVGERLVQWVETYYAGGDLFSDLYLLRDVTNTTKRH